MVEAPPLQSLQPSLNPSNPHPRTLPPQHHKLPQSTSAAGAVAGEIIGEGEAGEDKTVAPTIIIVIIKTNQTRQTLPTLPHSNKL